MSKKRRPAPGWTAKRGSLGRIERVESHEVDVVGEGDELADAVAFGDAAGSVGEDDCAMPEGAQNAHGKGDLLRRVAFVEMHAALHDDDRRAAQRSRQRCGRSGQRRWIAGSGESRRRERRWGLVTASATAPRPEPRTMAIFGVSGREPGLEECGGL